MLDLAFELQRKKEEVGEERKKITSGNLAVFKLSSMVSELDSYKKQILDPFREEPMRFIRIRPTLNKLQDCPAINLESLSFLFDTEDLNLVGELSAVQSHFRSIGESISERSKVHRDEMQPALCAAGIREGESYSLEKIRAVLNDRIYTTIVKSTDEIIEHVDGNLGSLIDLSRRLVLVLKEEFPDARIIAFRPPT